MDKKQFHQKLKQVYSHTKRGKHDSPYEAFRDMFVTQVVAKSGGGWDESIAAQTLAMAEHILGAQPEATQNAMLVKSKDAETELKRFWLIGNTRIVIYQKVASRRQTVI